MLWRVQFAVLENVFGLPGLALIVFAVAVWQLGPDWGALVTAGAPTRPCPRTRTPPTYWYYAVALFGAAMTPYEVFFFSSGGVEENWSAGSLRTMRANVFIGFPLGGLLSLAIAAARRDRAAPAGHRGRHPRPGGAAGASSPSGKVGLALVLVGFFAATFGAACETGLSAGYSVAQYFGWQWGKFVEPLRAARFHTVVLLSLRRRRSASCSRRSTRSWSPSTRSCSAPSRCR